MAIEATFSGGSGINATFQGQAPANMTAAQIEALLDAYFGDTEWRTGGTSSDLGTFNPSAITLDQDGFYDAYNPPGNVVLAFAGTPKNGKWQVVEITLEAGETITIPEAGIIYEDSFTDGVAPGAGTYKLWMGYDEDEYSFILSSFTRKTTIVPSATSLSITGTLEVGETLTLNYTYNANDGGAESGSTFKWYRADDAGGTNEAEISGATASTYVLQSADNGKYIRASVTPSDGTLTGVETFAARVGAIDLPTLSTPTLALTPGDTELDYAISNEDAAATGGILTYDTNSDFSTEIPVPGYSFAAKTGTITGLTNGTIYYVRLINTASGYNNSLPGSDSETPVSGAVQLNAPTQSTPTVDSSTAITVTIDDPNSSPQESTVLFRRADDAGMSVNVVTSQQAAGTLTHQFTGLTASTEYFFDAIHEGDGVTTLDSDPSNVQSATTTSGATLIQDSSPLGWIRHSESGLFTLDGSSGITSFVSKSPATANGTRGSVGGEPLYGASSIEFNGAEHLKYTHAPLLAAIDSVTDPWTIAIVGSRNSDGVTDWLFAATDDPSDGAQSRVGILVLSTNQIRFQKRILSVTTFNQDLGAISQGVDFILLLSHSSGELINAYLNGSKVATNIDSTLGGEFTETIDSVWMGSLEEVSFSNSKLKEKIFWSTAKSDADMLDFSNELNSIYSVY